MPPSAPQSRLPEASPYASHIPALDGIRGLAVLAVIGSHVFPGTSHNAFENALRACLSFGATGVDLFFVLSGFLITGILFDSLRDGQYFRKFYARRVLRIFPLYYAVLGLYALGGLILGMHFDRQLWSLALYLQNTGLITAPIYAYRGPSPLPLGHFWSLAIEEQFYLVWPLVVFLVRRRSGLLAICLGATLLCPVLRAVLWGHGWPYYPVHENTLLRADALLAGAALALLVRSRWHDKVLSLAPWLTAACTVLVGLILVSEAFPSGSPAWWPKVGDSLRYTVLNGLYVGLIAMALRPGKTAGLCNWAPLRSLGKYSYGLYVLHLPLFDFLQEPLRTLIATHVTSSRSIGVVLTGLICFAISCLAAVASFHLFEQRFLRLKRFFSYTKPAPANQHIMAA